MHTLQNAMFPLVYLGNPLPRRLSPSQKYHAPRPHFHHRINDFLRELLPPVIRMAICLVRAHRETGVEKEDSAVCPWGEEAAVLGRRGESRVVVFEGYVNVFQGGWRGDGGANGEAETVGLVEVVVGVLADDDDFDGVEGGVSGPVGDWCQ